MATENVCNEIVKTIETGTIYDFQEAMSKYQVNSNFLLPNGENLLHVAARHNRKDVGMTMLSRNADPNQESNDGKTPTCVAIEKRSTDMVRLLLQYGADPKKRWKPPNSFALARGKSLLRIAVENNATDIAEILLGWDAWSLERRGEQVALLATAKRSGNKELVSLLEQRPLGNKGPRKSHNVHQTDIDFFKKIIGHRQFQVRSSTVRRGKLSVRDLRDLAYKHETSRYSRCKTNIVEASVSSENCSGISFSSVDCYDKADQWGDLFYELFVSSMKAVTLNNGPNINWGVSDSNDQSEDKTVWLSKKDAALCVSLFGLKRFKRGKSRPSFQQDYPLRLVLQKRIVAKAILRKFLREL